MSDIVERAMELCNSLRKMECSHGSAETVFEAAETIITLRKAYEAAVVFIDSHVADPDITDEMVRAYAEYQRTSAALSTTEAK